MKAIGWLVVLITSTGAHAPALKHEGAETLRAVSEKLSNEFLGCSVYYTVKGSCSKTRGAFGPAESRYMESAVKLTKQAGLLYETIDARSQMFLKYQQEKIANNCRNAGLRVR